METGRRGRGSQYLLGSGCSGHYANDLHGSSHFVLSCAIPRWVCVELWWVSGLGRRAKASAWSPNDGTALDLWLEMGYSVMKGAHLVTPDFKPSCTLYTQSWTVSSLFHSNHHLHLLVGPITKVWSQALGHFQNCSIIFDPCFWLFITKLDTLNKIGYFLVFFFFVFLLWTICRSFSVERVLPLRFYSLFTVQVAALLHFQPCLFCAPTSGKATLHTQSYIFNEQI